MPTAGSNSSRQSELFEPSTYLDCDTGPGYFSILQKLGDTMEQRSYALNLLARVVQAVDPNYDTWISQASFKAKNRRAVNLRALGLLFSDLDTYHCPGLTGLSPEAQVSKLLAYLQSEGLPPPSVVLYSGRGLQAKWLLRAPIRQASILRWNEVQRALCQALDCFAADPKARDVSRVLRLEQTINTKSHELVRVVHVQGSAEDPARYSFEDLEALLLPRLKGTASGGWGYGISQEDSLNPPPPGETTRIRTLASHGRTLVDLAWARMEDIRLLWILRGGCKEGFRELTLFWLTNFLFLARPVPASQFWYESQTLAAETYPGPWYKQSDLATVYEKARQYAEGRRVIFNRRAYPPLYTPRNETLAEQFQITAEEERQLSTIISQTEKNRRLREKRWAEGVRPRSSMPKNTRPWEAFGISRATWFRQGCPLP